MANKLFRINRTEDEDTSTAGPATITRADDPQLLSIVPLDKDKGQPDVADPVENRIYATKEDEQEILFVTDKVTEGDFNPVTSNAVAMEFNNISIDLRLSAKNITFPFTADSDGIFAANCACTSVQDGYVYFHIVRGTLTMRMSSQPRAGGSMHISFPLLKGDVLTVHQIGLAQVQNPIFYSFILEKRI